MNLRDIGFDEHPGSMADRRDRFAAIEKRPHEFYRDLSSRPEISEAGQVQEEKAALDLRGFASTPRSTLFSHRVRPSRK